MAMRPRTPGRSCLGSTCARAYVGLGQFAAPPPYVSLAVNRPGEDRTGSFVPHVVRSHRIHAAQGNAPPNEWLSPRGDIKRRDSASSVETNRLKRGAPTCLARWRRVRQSSELAYANASGSPGSALGLASAWLVGYAQHPPQAVSCRPRREHSTRIHDWCSLQRGGVECVSGTQGLSCALGSPPCARPRNRGHRLIGVVRALSPRGQEHGACRLCAIHTGCNPPV